MSDLVERLRAANQKRMVIWPAALINEAADRIEALEAAARALVDSYKVEGNSITIPADRALWDALRRALQPPGGDND